MIIFFITGLNKMYYVNHFIFLFSFLIWLLKTLSYIYSTYYISITVLTKNRDFSKLALSNTGATSHKCV